MRIWIRNPGFFRLVRSGAVRCLNPLNNTNYASLGTRGNGEGGVVVWRGNENTYYKLRSSVAHLKQFFKIFYDFLEYIVREVSKMGFFLLTSFLFLGT